MRRKVLLSLPEAFDKSLAERRMAQDATAIASSYAQIRRVVETAVLAELGLTLLAPGEEAPAPFPALFAGVATADGWFDLFIRDAADQIKDATAKDDGAFQRIWDAEQTALVKAIGEANSVILSRLDRRTEAMQRDMAEVLEFLRGSDRLQRAAEQGIPEAAIRAIIERLGGEGVGREDLIPWLDNWIEAAREELGRRTDEGEAFEAARQEAERRFRAGRLRDASAAFMDEFAREERLEANVRPNESATGSGFWKKPSGSTSSPSTGAAW